MWLIDEFTADMTAAHYAPSTIRLRRYQVARFARAHPEVWQVTGGQVVDYLARCRSPEYAKSVKAALHMFYVWGIRTGRTQHDPTVVVPAVRVPPPAPRPCPERVLTGAIMRVQDPSTRLMLLLAAQSGLRRAEIARLHSRDVEGEYLWVMGKGSKQRRVPISEAVRIELAGRPGWVFPGRGGHLSPDAVGRRMSRALGPGWTAHTLRHRAATRGYRAQGDLLAVQRLLGHASVATTQRYVAVDDDELRALVAANS